MFVIPVHTVSYSGKGLPLYFCINNDSDHYDKTIILVSKNNNQTQGIVNYMVSRIRFHVFKFVFFFVFSCSLSHIFSEPTLLLIPHLFFNCYYFCSWESSSLLCRENRNCFHIQRVDHPFCSLSSSLQKMTISVVTHTSFCNHLFQVFPKSRSFQLKHNFTCLPFVL